MDENLKSEVDDVRQHCITHKFSLPATLVLQRYFLVYLQVSPCIAEINKETGKEIREESSGIFYLGMEHYTASH